VQHRAEAIVGDRGLAFYARPSGMTSAGRHAALFDELPNDVGELVRIVQHLVVYDVVAADFYGFTLPAKRQGEIHIRPLEKMVERLLGLDDRKLSVARTVDRRLAGRCRHFTLFLVGMLRAKGVPARARCGFGSYFNPPYFEDHWVCEYWNTETQRWILVDPQFDEVWRQKLGIEHDVLDVPRDRFVVAADAWDQCRTGGADPSRFGISFSGLRGLWFVAGSLVRDVAALNKMEMLPWDVWGAQPRPDESLGEGQIAFFDGLASLTSTPDAPLDALRTSYEGDDRLRVPTTVFNALLNRSEACAGAWDGAALKGNSTVG
jgi:Transglutaminase-like superfamily